VVAQRRPPFTIGPEFRVSPKERVEQNAATAAAFIELFFDSPRQGDRRLLERARQALDQALSDA
jgi:hypothetical protein